MSLFGSWLTGRKKDSLYSCLHPVLELELQKYVAFEAHDVNSKVPSAFNHGIISPAFVFFILLFIFSLTHNGCFTFMSEEKGFQFPLNWTMIVVSDSEHRGTRLQSSVVAMSTLSCWVFCQPLCL